MSRAVTRAQALSVRPKVLERQTRRKLDRARMILEDLAVLWSAIDGGIEHDLEAAYEKIREIDGDGGSLIEAIERLNAPDDADYEAEL